MTLFSPELLSSLCYIPVRMYNKRCVCRCGWGDVTLMLVAGWEGFQGLPAETSKQRHGKVNIKRPA